VVAWDEAVKIGLFVAWPGRPNCMVRLVTMLLPRLGFPDLHTSFPEKECGFLL
jgi:hypothetical protein